MRILGKFGHEFLFYVPNNKDSEVFIEVHGALV